MRRNFVKNLAISAAALVGLTTSTSVKQETIVEKKDSKQSIEIDPLVAGLKMPPIFPNQFGMSPKEYGTRYGNGGTKRSNRNRYTHNAKLKRRMAA